MSVDLPAPFSPTSACTSPAYSSRWAPRSAWTAPKLLFACSRASTGAVAPASSWDIGVLTQWVNRFSTTFFDDTAPAGARQPLVGAAPAREFRVRPRAVGGLGYGRNVTENTLRTAYGRPALDLLAREVGAAKSGAPMAPVTVIAPTNIAGIVARRHLAQQGPGLSGLKITSLPRLAQALAAHTLHPRRPPSTALLAAAWRTALAQPGLFAVVADP